MHSLWLAESAFSRGLSPATSQYINGGLPTFMSAPELQPGGRMDTVLRGPGYPEPVTPVSLLPNDRLATMRQWTDQMKLARSNVRHGWMRSDG